MFDYIKIEYPLHSLPQRLIDQWNGDVTFQTKDTPEQTMSLYKIDKDGKLWYEERETEWVESTTPDAEWFLDRIGHMKTISKTWKQINFSGCIRFYESYNHDDYKFEFNSGTSKEWQRYELGWVEYKALFQNDQMISMDLVEHTEPIKLTDEELELKIDEQCKQREERCDNLKKSRKERPTAVQRLVDNINNECKLVETINKKVDLELALNNVKNLIKEYRTIHDNWYEEVE
jgi:hypothetical protein